MCGRLKSCHLQSLLANKTYHQVIAKKERFLFVTEIRAIIESVKMGVIINF